jgi:hypothetical protein
VRLADLRIERLNPTTLDARRWTSRVKSQLGALAVGVMFLIGGFTVVLQGEQRLLQTGEQYSAADAAQLLTQLRRFARDTQGRSTDSLVQQEYARRVAAFRKSASSIEGMGGDLREAYERPSLWPWSLPQLAFIDDANAQNETAAAPATAPAAAAAARPLCHAVDSDVVLPDHAQTLPAYMREVYRELLSDFCFRQRVLSVDGVPSADLGINHSVFLQSLRRKVDIGANWALPFLFGLLGTLIHLLRTIGDERRRPMSSTDIAVRLSLGSVGGIVVGWFVASASPGLNGSLGGLSVPLAMSFLTGYGIEILFRALDRLSRTLETPPERPKAGSAAPGTTAAAA